MNQHIDQYIEKYPWLRLRNLWTGEIDPNTNAMQEMPEGWEIAFGDLFCEEMDAVLKEEGLVDKFVIEQIKEKFGSLRIYVSPAPSERVRAVIRKYEVLSGNICIRCGKPDVPMLNTYWISPYCKDCYSKLRSSNNEPYEDVAEKDPRMKDRITYRVYGPERSETLTWEEIVQNFGDTPERIRKKWETEHNN